MKQVMCIILALAAMLSLHSCGGSDCAQQFSHIDSLLAQGRSAQAVQELKNIPSGNLNDEDKARYAVLMTEARLDGGKAIANDSIIGEAVEYYNGSNDRAMQARALILRGRVNEDLGNLEDAVDCYHHAEDIAQNTDNNLLVDAKMKLGKLYHNQIVGANTIALDKYREALPLIKASGDREKELTCLSEMGSIYRGISHHGDSAAMCLNDAIALARQLGNKRTERSCLFLLAEYYCEIAHDYERGKALAQQSLAIDDRHPRAHYCLALCYLHLGQVDSARHCAENSPERTTAVELMWYYNTMSEIEKASHNDALSRQYYDKSNAMGDSMLITSLNHRLLAVEKNYDKQKSELHNQVLQSSLQRTLLVTTIIVIVALVIMLFALRYRNKLKIKQNEYELLTADLDASLTSLEEMKNTLHRYEGKLSQADENTRKVDEIKGIIDEQIKSLHQLILWSYEYDEKKFAAKFNNMMAINDDNNESFLKNIQSIANDLHSNILIKAQEAAGGTLRDDEVKFLALYCCGFSRTVIMVCMKYKSLGTVYNKRVQIARKLNAANIDEFINANK